MASSMMQAKNVYIWIAVSSGMEDYQTTLSNHIERFGLISGLKKMAM